MTSHHPSPIGTSQPTCPEGNSNLSFEMRSTSTPRGARLARRPAAHRLDVWGIPYGTRPHEEVVLVLGELTANAVRHGHVPGRDFRLLLRVGAPARTVRVEVTDTRGDRTPPDPRELPVPGTEDTGGRGLLLVAALAVRWGWHPRRGGPGKTVWAECVSAACEAAGPLRRGRAAWTRVPRSDASQVRRGRAPAPNATCAFRPERYGYPCIPRRASRSSVPSWSRTACKEQS